MNDRSRDVDLWWAPCLCPDLPIQVQHHSKSLTTSAGSRELAWSPSSTFAIDWTCCSLHHHHRQTFPTLRHPPTPQRLAWFQRLCWDCPVCRGKEGSPAPPTIRALGTCCDRWLARAAASAARSDPTSKHTLPQPYQQRMAAVLLSTDLKHMP